MARRIEITQEMIDGYIQRLVDQLQKMRVFDGKLNISANFNEIDEKTTVCFTERAFMKQLALVQQSDKEVAWHGTAKRLEGGDGYVVEDIYVYPQEVTGATVTTDQKQYEGWLDSLDDEQFHKLRFHGHSHVNMTTSPSSTDEEHYEGLVKSLRDDDFYIFFITNKAGAKTTMVYDIGKNVMYEPKDINVVVIGDSNLGAFLREAKDMVKTEVITPYQRTCGTYVPSAYGTHGATGQSWTRPASTPPVTTKGKKSKKKDEAKKSGTTQFSGAIASWLQEDDDDEFDEYIYERYERRDT